MRKLNLEDDGMHIDSVILEEHAIINHIVTGINNLLNSQGYSCEKLKGFDLEGLCLKIETVTDEEMKQLSDFGNGQINTIAVEAADKIAAFIRDKFQITPLCVRHENDIRTPRPNANLVLILILPKDASRFIQAFRKYQDSLELSKNDGQTRGQGIFSYTTHKEEHEKYLDDADGQTNSI